MNKKYLKYFLIGILAIVAVAVFNWPTKQSGRVLSGFTTTTSGQLKICFFDVGQGDSALIIDPSGEEMLVDGGPDNKVIQQLTLCQPAWNKKIDYVLLTHPHADHVTGLVEVLKRYQVGEVIMTGADHTAAEYLQFLDEVKSQKLPTLIIDQPQELKLGDSDLQFLEPRQSYVGRTLANLNDSSIVFKLSYVSSTALFTGDFDLEEGLVTSTIDLKSDLLKVGHHGSTNANDRSFLKAVSPRYAVISVGKNNTYGLPNYRTIYDLEQLGTQVFRTDDDGSIIFASDGRTWQHQP